MNDVKKKLAALGLLTTLLLLSTKLVAGENQYLNFQKINIESPVHSVEVPWLKKVKEFPGSGYKLICGHLILPETWVYHERFYERAKYKCHVGILAFDIVENSLIVFIDAVYNGFTMARYPAKIQGKPLEYFEALNNEIYSQDLKLNSLARTINRMSRDDIQFGQLRNLESENLQVTALSQACKRDPLNQKPRIGIDVPDGNTRPQKIVNMSSFRRIIFESRDVNPDDYPEVDKLYEKIEHTLEVLEHGYEILKENSDQENREIFHQYLLENAGIIKAELKNLMHELKNGTYNLVEILGFLNDFSALIQAIDDILVLERGSDPGFLVLISD